jgi:serine/threonine-protein kinase RsbT
MRIVIKSDEDVITSRSAAKEMAKEIGFGIVDQTKIATAISELTRNIIKYADEGLLNVTAISAGDRKGIELICEDRGPGINDIGLALKDGFSTSGGLGMGLSGAKRLMDEFELESKRGKGTRVVARKWL